MKERVKEIPHELKESAQKIWLAGMGAFVLAEEEGSRLFKELVERGQSVNNLTENTRKKMTGSVDQVKGQLGSLFTRMEDLVNSGISTGLSKVGVPSKDEIELLTKRVEELMQSVDGLKEPEVAPAKKPVRRTAAKKAPAKTTKTVKAAKADEAKPVRRTRRTAASKA